MSRAPVLRFSHHFPATIWSMRVNEQGHKLVLEIRDELNFETSFSLFDYDRNEFVWSNLSVAEPWWVSLAAINQNTILVNRFLNKGGNPDHKSLIAIDVATGSVRWEKEEVSFFSWNDSEVQGYQTKEDLVPVTINLVTGEMTEAQWPTAETERTEQIKPIFYAEGTTHFETVRKFLAPIDYKIVKGVEYLEFNGWIIVSVYVEEAGKLANYLLVFDATDGTLCLSLKLGEKLTGLGAETFFILAGCLFLVQNKTDLVAYRL